MPLLRWGLQRKLRKGVQKFDDKYAVCVSETATLVHNVLYSRKGMYPLTDFLHDFKYSSGYDLPCYGQKSVKDFLIALGPPVQVVTIDETTYLHIIDRPSIFKRKTLLGPDNETNRSLDRGGIRPPPDSSSDEESEQQKTKKVVRRFPRKTTLPKAKFGNCVFEWINDIDNVCVKCSGIFTPENKIAWIDRCLTIVMLEESDIPRLELRHHLDIGCFVDVVVPEVRNPHRFILQLKKYQDELSDLMGYMMTFYTLYGVKYKVRTYKFQKDQVCAALYKTNENTKEWYRAKILTFGNEGSTIYLIDYGITTHICNSNLRFLNRAFGTLPAQALNGHLANIKPYRGKYFSDDCCLRFFDLVIDEHLVAEIVKYNPFTRWISMILLYPDGHGFRINDHLVRGEFPIADCDFFEDEFFERVFYDSIHEKEFLQPEEIGRTRKPRASKIVLVEVESDTEDSDPDYHIPMRKLFGVDDEDTIKTK